MRIIAAVLVAFLTCSYTGRDAFNDSTAGIIKPPEWAFTHPARPVLRIVQHDVPNDELNEICKFPWSGMGGGCAFYSKETTICTIYVNAGYDTTRARYRIVVKHEKAHCYGWPEDHSMARVYPPNS